MYETYKLLHVLAAMVWVGGSIIAQVFGARAGRSGDPKRTLDFTRDMEVAGRVFTVAGVLTLVFGVLMVLDSPVIEFEQAWIVIGFIGIAAGVVLGAGFYGPKVKGAIAQMESGDAGAAATIKQVIVVSQAEVVLLLVVVWAMVFKPGL